MGSIPPFVQQVIGTVVRAALVWLAAYLANRGVTLNDSQVAQVIAWATPLVVALAWSVWQKYRGRQKLLTAAASPHALTEEEVEERLADPAVPTPSVNTPKSEVPQ